MAEMLLLGMCYDIKMVKLPDIFFFIGSTTSSQSLHPANKQNNKKTFLHVNSHEKRLSARLFPNVKYKDLCATIKISHVYCTMS